MGSLRVKVIVLGALAVVWVALLVGRGLLPGGNPAAPTETKEVGPRTEAKPGFPRLNRALIEAERPPYPPETQSLFGAPPPPPPPPRAAGTGPNGMPGGAPPPPPAPPPPDPFQEGARQLKYLGFLRGGGTATAFITQGPDLYTVATGEVIAGRFRVVDVQDDAVVVASPAGDKQVRVLLVPEAGAGPAGGRPAAAPPPAPAPGR